MAKSKHACGKVQIGGGRLEMTWVLYDQTWIFRKGTSNHQKINPNVFFSRKGEDIDP